jgi:hypothetical protein
MAKMIPPVISPSIASSAEKRIFEWFSNAPKTEDWVVLHSLGISNHTRHMYGEIDFLVLAPKLGVYALEVKGGGVRREEGVWYFTDRYQTEYTREIGPFDQARNAIFSIINSIKERVDYENRHLEDVFFGFGVMFPDIRYEVSGIDEERWQVFDSEDQQDVGEFIRRLARGTQRKWEALHGPLRRERLPTFRDVGKLMKILRGDFDKTVPMSVQLRLSEDSLITLTNEQYDCLDQLQDNMRCLVTGAAGTGKTLLALEEAKRSTVQRKKTALICYNKFLGEWLNAHFDQLEDSLRPDYVGTFHNFMKDLLRQHGIDEKVSQEDTKEYFEEKLPNDALSLLLELDEPRFDCLIIDEAQDLVRENYLDVMDASLSGGLKRGSWRFFGDFQHQAIYSGGAEGDTLIEMLEDRSSFGRFRLKINCRNTKPICDEMKIITGLESHMRDIRHAEGPPVKFTTYKDDEEQKLKLDETLKALCEQGVPKKKITILSAKRRDRSVISLFSEDEIADYNIELGDRIAFSTIHGYKGLENSAIILVDVDNFGEEQLMYVALSRARSYLHIFCTRFAQKEYYSLVFKEGDS